MTSGIDISSYKLTIFNRWGEIVFVSQDINQGWDGTNKTGKKSQDGVYKYVIEFSRKNVDEPERFDGHVNLLR
jgi:gliding motility-associated-like protein